MKKIMAILCAAALALSLTGVSFADENLALSGTAIADSVGTAAATPTPEADAIDGDTATRWQSAAKGNAGDDAWFGVMWEEAQTFNKIVIDWETAHPTENGFKIQISNDGETWTDTAFTAVRTGTEADDHQKDTIALTAAATSKYVRVFCFEAYVNAGGNVKEQPSIYEFEVYNDGTVGGGNENVGGNENENENQGGNENTGVASTVAFAVVAMSAAAVAFKSKKNA